MLKKKEVFIKYPPFFNIRRKMVFAVLLALLAVLLTAFWDNAALLRLPASERGTFSVADPGELGGHYVDQLSCRIEGEIRLKPSADADWAVFPAGTRSLRLRQEIHYTDGSGEAAAGTAGGVQKLPAGKAGQQEQETADASQETGAAAGDRTAGTEAVIVYDNNPAYLTMQYLPVKGRVDSVSIEAVAPDLQDDSAGAAAAKEQSADGGDGTSEELLSAEAAAQTYPQFDFSELRFTDFQIVNEVRINPYPALFTFLAAFCLLMLFYFRTCFFQRPERAFLLICLMLGLTAAVSLPRNKVGYDEETHLQAAMDVAAFPGELHISDAVVNDLIVTDFNDPDYQPRGAEEMRLFNERLSAEGNYKDGENSPDFYTLPNRVPAYLAMAAGLKFGKGLSLSWPALLLLGRIGNLLLYAALMYAAIRIAPAGKLLLTAIALFPENIFLAVTYSYDPYVTGCLMLGMAAFLRELWPDASKQTKRRRHLLPLGSGGDRNGKNVVPSNRTGGTADWGNLALMLAAFALGCLPKAVYAPLLLIALMLPASHFRSRRGKWGYRAAVVLVFVLLLATFILPTVISPAETGDVRGGATSEVSQVGFILQNPLRYAGTLLSQMIRWIPQCFIGPDCTTFMGHLVSGYTAWKGLWIPVFAVLILAVFAERKSAQSGARAYTFRPAQRVFIFLMIGAASVLVWTSMYVAFTEPGAREIAGVQGRYFIPMMFPLYLLFAVGSLRKRQGAAPQAEPCGSFSAAAGNGAPALNEKPEQIAASAQAGGSSAADTQNAPAAASKLARHFDLWYYFIQSLSALLLAATVWIAVIEPFCI